ncbi:MAG: hypothetical protein CTY20_13100 [Hyphomicrobium sp.]|nr:MAG: hypothetical protein CTY20_13100 [Hyphomicrobium sp.]
MTKKARSALFALTLSGAAWACSSWAGPKEATPETPWTPILRQSLVSEKNCALTEILYFRELKLGDDLALEGRVRCVDGREFEFTRPRPHVKFSFALCQPAVC